MSKDKQDPEADTQNIERGDRSQKTTSEQEIPTTREDVQDDKSDGFKETKRTGYGDS